MCISNYIPYVYLDAITYLGSVPNLRPDYVISGSEKVPVDCFMKVYYITIETVDLKYKQYIDCIAEWDLRML